MDDLLNRVEKIEYSLINNEVSAEIDLEDQSNVIDLEDQSDTIEAYWQICDCHSRH